MKKHLHILLALAALVLPLLSYAAELSLSIGDFSTSMSKRDLWLEGQQVQLSVRVVRGGGERYLGLPDRPPYTLKIVAGTNSSQGFMENSLWTRALSLQPYVDRYRMRADSLYKSKGTPVDVDGDQTNLGELYQFASPFLKPRGTAACA